MKKNFKILFCMFIMLGCCILEVKAETTTTAEDKSCSYASQAYLNKLAGSVSVSYDFKYADNGNVSFDITVYNLTEELYVNVTSSSASKNVKKQNFTILPNMVNDNKYTFNVTDTENIIEYEFIVKSMKYGCTHDIRKFTLVKPKKNKFHDRSVCHYEEVQDYYYCQEWITTNFSLNDQEVEEKIILERQKVQSTGTTQCVECDVDARNKAQRERFNMIKSYIIIGLSIGIIFDLIIIVMLIRNIRRQSRW